VKEVAVHGSWFGILRRIRPNGRVMKAVGMRRCGSANVRWNREQRTANGEL
jgi:hypothetical protein